MHVRAKAGFDHVHHPARRVATLACLEKRRFAW